MADQPNAWIPVTSIRPNALGFFRRGDEYLMIRVIDGDGSLKGYRAPGGGIEFQEVAVDALKREIMEELGTTIRVGKLLNVAENIFTFNGKPGHEICFMYEAEFEDKSFYLKDQVEYVESDKQGEYMVWVNPATANRPIFPDNVAAILNERGAQ